MGKLSWSKWSKHKVLSGTAELSAHLPETHLLTPNTFWSMMAKYRRVIVKPTTSSGGNGVLLISAQGNGLYRVHSGRYRKTLDGKNKTYAYLQKWLTRAYLVQQPIALTTIDSRPFDLRIMAQRRQTADWTITGKLAKVAGNGYIVTNIARSRGKVLTVAKALELSELKNVPQQALLAQIDRISLQAVRRLHRVYTGVRTMGIDLGLDQKGKVWIIEANFTPMTSLFRKLGDTAMYKRIMSYR